MGIFRSKHRFYLRVLARCGCKRPPTNFMECLTVQLTALLSHLAEERSGIDLLIGGWLKLSECAALAAFF